MEFNLASTIISAGAGAALGAFANALMQGRNRWIDTQMLAAALARKVMMCGRKLAACRYEVYAEHQIGLSKTARRDKLHRSACAKISRIIV